MHKIWSLSSTHYILLTVGYVTWLLCAVFWPMLDHSKDWAAVQDVWDRWQTLNVGMLALAASVIAYRAAVYRDEAEARRNLIGAKPFLPEQLSALTAYNRECFASLRAASQHVQGRGSMGSVVVEGLVVPELPQGYRDVFRDIIKYAPADLARYLSVLLAELQIHHARFSDLPNQFSDESSLVLPINIMDYIRNLGVIQARVNALFPFARGEVVEFDNPRMTIADLSQAIRVGGIEIGEIDRLQEFLEPAVERANKKVLPDAYNVPDGSDQN